MPGIASSGSGSTNRETVLSLISCHDMCSARALLLLIVAAGTGAALGSRAESVPPASQQIAELGDCALANGQMIQHCRVGYRLHGALNAARSNIVVVPSWYNGNSGALEELIGPGRLFDTTNWYIVSVDALGDGVSSSPSNATPEQQGIKFPSFTIGDMIGVEKRLLAEILGFNHVHAITGVSMGGLQTYQWAVSAPEFMDVAIPILGTPWPNSADLMTWTVMLRAIEMDPAYEGGNYRQEPPLFLANDLDTMFAYTSDFRARAVPVEHFPKYLREAHTAANIGANNRVWQLRALLGQNVLSGRPESSLGTMKLPKMAIITSRWDQTVNPAPSIAWARATHSRLVVLDSDCGHLATLCQPQPVIAAVKDALGAP
jgi:homoserine O-acetyltransferase